MKIIRKHSIHGNYSPAAANVLGQIPSGALFNVSHQLRHPESIYSLSLDKVGKAFCNVAEGYLLKAQAYQDNQPPAAWEINQLLKDQEDFLRALQEHLDDLWLILQTLIDPVSATKTSLFADKYVLGNKLPGAKSFQEAIAGYKMTLKIANKLKHQQGRLRGVAIWLPRGPHLGYFLEGPDANGIIGPSTEIHPDQGAISFSRDLTWHLFNVYFCSEKLVAAVNSALGARGLTARPAVESGNKDWQKVISLALKIPPAYFPKEVPKHAAIFKCHENEQTLEVEFPKRILFKFPLQMKTSCCTQVDGHSTTFKVPFP